MKNIFPSLLIFSSVIFSNEISGAALQSPKNENMQIKEDLAMFNPPSGWLTADRSKIDLPPLVRVMVVGKSSSNFPPSMNLTSAPYQGTLKQYLQIVKNRNLQSQNEWKDLGTIRTQAGNGSLSQIDSKSPSGDIRQMHVILLKNGVVYILTAAALKSEFSLYYQDFFRAMQSLRISNDPLEMLASSVQKNELRNEIKKIHFQWASQLSQKSTPELTLEEKKEQIFNGEPFKSQTWAPFQEKLGKLAVDLGSEWSMLVSQNVKEELFAVNNQKK